MDKGLPGGDELLELVFIYVPAHVDTPCSSLN